mmetsp:Transcript_67044/g.111457  ORF Transcript_67044/g.111457 Transcript_67044/m.111457 type:complete len:420 (+) Transcript_67044:131-1390(+)|eukprot:CAMPEP_0119312170 /NCGR_PEP_ID=MMETSP1333-20130426/25281_1 /TAXON_ID=418940 /ORGANISM="Scyphosphaera apsteinii, Strain RCC1455" /LENGTH=419 /DNA_ID=CAMNT_0007316745 /DNA_START=120 /DNA_END=1379 /DNA_ORIENTATION=+
MGDFLERLAAAEKTPADTSIPDCITLRKLGSGSSGTCYLMQHHDGSLVVQKRVPVSHMNPSDQERVEREVNILASLVHPHIICYHKAFIRQGQLCVVMEHASCGDLAQHLEHLRKQQEQVQEEQALNWFMQLLMALRYMHTFKVLHRDVAMKNVFLSADGHAKLGDFGVARVLDSTDELALSKVGTPCYISPERCEGKPYSYSSDVWGLGCLLCELLTMRPAFAAETIPQLSHNILSGSMTSAVYNLGSELQALVRSLLSVQASLRPSLDALLSEPILQATLAEHTHLVDLGSNGGNKEIASVDIPLIGYEGCSKTKFSERPTFVDGGRRIVDESNLSEHDQKMLDTRRRRQQLVARRTGSYHGRLPSQQLQEATQEGLRRASSDGPQPMDFSKTTNFGPGGIVAYLQQCRSDRPAETG